MSQQKQLGCVGIGCLPILIILAVVISGNRWVPNRKPDTTEAQVVRLDGNGARQGTLTELGVTPEHLVNIFESAMDENLIFSANRNTGVVYVNGLPWRNITGENKQLLIDSIAHHFRETGGMRPFATVEVGTNRVIETVAR